MQRRNVTLKEKLVEHYHKKDDMFQPKPKDASNLGMSFFWGMTVTVFFEMIFVLIPSVHRDDVLQRVLCWLIFCYMAMVSVMTWFLCFADLGDQVKSIHKEKRFPDSLQTPPGWRNCPTCQVDSPPRSYHCSACNKCVLKRDHHCYFSGNCIGYYNQRYYIVFLVYMVVVNAWAIFEMAMYLHDYLPVYDNVASYVPLVAWVLWIGGYGTFSSAFLITHMYLCLACLVSAYFFLFWQILFISAGYTTYEAHKGIRVYQQTFLENIRSVFGHLRYAWFLFLFPWPLQMCGDGIEFKRKRAL